MITGLNMPFIMQKLPVDCVNLNGKKDQVFSANSLTYSSAISWLLPKYTPYYATYSRELHQSERQKRSTIDYNSETARLLH